MSTLNKYTKVLYAALDVIEGLDYRDKITAVSYLSNGCPDTVKADEICILPCNGRGPYLTIDVEDKEVQLYPYEDSVRRLGPTREYHETIGMLIKVAEAVVLRIGV